MAQLRDVPGHRNGSSQTAVREDWAKRSPHQGVEIRKPKTQEETTPNIKPTLASARFCAKSLLHLRAPHQYRRTRTAEDKFISKTKISKFRHAPAKPETYSRWRGRDRMGNLSACEGARAHKRQRLEAFHGKCMADCFALTASA